MPGYFNRNVRYKRANYSPLHCGMVTTFRVLNVFGSDHLKIDVEK